MERGFLSQKILGERGVKEKSIDRNKTNIAGNGLFTSSYGTLNEVTPVFAVQEGVTSTMVDMNVEKEKLSYLKDNTVLRPFPPLPTQETTSVGDAPGFLLSDGNYADYGTFGIILRQIGSNGTQRVKNQATERAKTNFQDI